MAVQSLAKRTSARFSLNQGTDPDSGKTITKYVTLNKLASNPDGSKVMAVVNAAVPCLVGSLGTVETTEVKTLEEV